MGDVDHLVAEPDELMEEEVEAVHPPHLVQTTPGGPFGYVINLVLGFVYAYGWTIVGFMLLGWLAWTNFGHYYKKWREKRDDAYYKKNPDAFLAKHQGMDEARQKMQERYNLAAAASLEKKKEMEEKKREEKLDKLAELERKVIGSGQRLGSQNRSEASASASTSSSGSKKTSAKPRLRPEYNPLTGDVGGGGGDSCRWRPTSRGQSGGG